VIVVIGNRFQKSNTKKKYRNVFVEQSGHKFASKTEAAYYAELQLRERAGILKIKELQPAIKMTRAQIKYVADFAIEENGREVWIDVKGFSNAVFNLKKRLYKKYGEHNLRIIKKTRFGFEIEEEITPDIE